MSNAQSAETVRGPLTKARIASLAPDTESKPGKKLPTHAYDGGEKNPAVAGLLVRCQPSGKKYYYYQFRRPAYVKKRETGEEVLNKNASTRICLGLVDDISIHKAREKARIARDAARAARRAELTGQNVVKKVHEALNNLEESVEVLEVRQEAKRTCPTAEGFIDNHYAEFKKGENKSFQDGREIQRLKYVLSVLSLPPKKGPKKGKKGDPEFNLLTRPLDEIDGMLIKRWRMARQKRVSDRTGKPPSKATVARELMMMRSMFNEAIECKYIKDNPLDGNSLSVVSERDVTPLTGKQVRRLQQVLIDREDRLRWQRNAANQFAEKEGGRVRPEIPDDEYVDFLRPLILLAMHTGLRFGELAGLQNKYVRLRNSKSSGDHSKLRIPDPKNKKPHTAPLNEFAEEVLKKWWRQRSTIDPDAYVFPDRKGNKLVYIRHYWAPVFREAGLPRGYRFHDLRHEYASKLAKKGVSLIELQRLLNHSNPKMVQRYVDFHPDWMKETVGKLTEDDEWIV